MFFKKFKFTTFCCFIPKFRWSVSVYKGNFQLFRRYRILKSGFFLLTFFKVFITSCKIWEFLITISESSESFFERFAKTFDVFAPAVEKNFIIGIFFQTLILLRHLHKMKFSTVVTDISIFTEVFYASVA